MKEQGQYACLYWEDENGFQHVMRGYLGDLVESARELDEIEYPWKIETSSYTALTDDSEPLSPSELVEMAEYLERHAAKRAGL